MGSTEVQAGATNAPGVQAEATGEKREMWGHTWGLQKSSGGHRGSSRNYEGSGGTGWGCERVMGAIKALGVQAGAVVEQ